MAEASLQQLMNHSAVLDDSMMGAGLDHYEDDEEVEATLNNLSRIAPDPDPRRVLSYNFEAVA